MATLKWWKIPNQSLSVAVRNVGFDLAIFDTYSRSTKKKIKRRATAESLRVFRDAFYDIARKDAREIKRGVYVICVSYPFTIKYDKSRSQIIYVGQGSVLSRLKTHYKKSLFDFMQSLSGVNFDFYVSEPKRAGTSVFYKHIEFLLLEKFSKDIGGGKRSFPLLNSKAGSNKGYSVDKGWNKPLKRSGKRPLWMLEATKFSDFASLD